MAIDQVGALPERAFAARDDALERPVHSDRTAAILGIALGVSFSVCFLTGLVSHLIQQPPGWLTWPARPAGLYRITQGLHVATGIASIPLLLAKLWSVFPRFFRWPPFLGPGDALERISLLPLVGGAVFQLMSGWQNTTLWYAWPFFFPTAHYWVAWVTMGGLVVHVGAKVATARRALSPAAPATPAPPAGTLSRRGYLGLVGAGIVGITLATVGQTVAPLRRLAIFSTRRPDTGSLGLPVNRSAVEAGIGERAVAPEFRLVVDGDVPSPLELSLADLEAMPRREATLPISCVEGWSANARWRGVPVRDLLRAAGVEDGREVEVEVLSLEEGWLYGQSKLNRSQSDDLDTLLALELNGERLDLDHGFPVRLIGPNRPGVQQTKWVTRLVVT